MGIVYRVLGLAAALGNRTSRFSINFLKLNWILMVLLGVGIAATGKELGYAVNNRAEPRDLTVAEAMSHADVASNFVRLRGNLISECAFQSTKVRNGAATVEASYFVMFDDDKKGAVLVQTESTAIPRPTDGKLTGMLMPIDSKLRHKLAETNGRIGPVAIDVDYVLELGRRPGNASTYAIALTVLAIAMLAMLATWKNRYIVFRGDGADATRSRAKPQEQQTGGEVPMTASGVFSLERTNKRFTCMPSVLLEAEGVPVACANVDASSNFMGIKTSNLHGIWTIPLGGAGRAIESGTQYYGFGCRPALRIVQAAGGREATTVLGFADEGARAAALQRLTAAAQ